MGTSGGSDKGLVCNTLSVSGVELSVTLVSAGGALMSVQCISCMRDREFKCNE